MGEIFTVQRSQHGGMIQKISAKAHHLISVPLQLPQYFPEHIAYSTLWLPPCGPSENSTGWYMILHSGLEQETPHQGHLINSTQKHTFINRVYTHKTSQNNIYHKAAYHKNVYKRKI